MLGNTVDATMSEVLAAPPWAPDSPPRGHLDWRTVDRALRAIRQRRATLDAEEARWLREAEALQIWRPLGMVSALDYLERVLGYAPRTAQDRLRVARALGDPTIERVIKTVASTSLPARPAPMVAGSRTRRLRPRAHPSRRRGGRATSVPRERTPTRGS
jgi:hypothetical protein